MTEAHFPNRIRALEPFTGPFAAYRLAASECEVLFASYPADTRISLHSHETENHGVITAGALFLTVDGEETRYGPGEWYYLPPNKPHAARFETDTSEIEFWFTAG